MLYCRLPFQNEPTIRWTKAVVRVVKLEDPNQSDGVAQKCEHVFIAVPFRKTDDREMSIQGPSIFPQALAVRTKSSGLLAPVTS